MKKVFYAIAVCAICFSSNAYCQGNNAVLQNIVAKLKTLSTDHVIEKSYLHFDKPYYAAGDTMYFKAYVTLGERHDLSKASGILYVNLVDARNVIKNSIKLQLVEGTGWGDFILPDSLQRGNYRVRAYTRYIQNDPEYFFDKMIPVGAVNNKPADDNTVTAQAAAADIQFFPEGGDLVNGLVSKIGFKAIGTNGLGINVKGVIIDKANNEVASFSSAHLGMGAFYFEPQEGESYKAKVTYANGTQATMDLPKSLSSGIVLAVSDTLGKISVQARCNKAYLKDNLNKDINIVLYSGGVVNSVSTKLDNRIINMDVPNSTFATGIVEVTLFSQSGEPLSERLVFVQNPDLLNVAVNTDKTVYKKHDKTEVTINAKNSRGIGANGSFSVSVIDENIVPVNENAESTILTDLLLTADLKGYVEQPNYYFSNNTGAYADLDDLLLTQGYRRFSWKKLLNDNTSFAFAPETAFEITGVAKTGDGVPYFKKPVLMRAANSAFNGNVLTGVTDENGKFKFANLAYTGDGQLILQPGNLKGKNVPSISVDAENPEPEVSSITVPGSAADVNKTMSAYLDNSRKEQKYSNAIALKTVHVNEIKKSSYRSSNINGAGNADQVIKGDDIREFTSLSDALNGRLHGGYVHSGTPYLLRSALSLSSNQTTQEPMLVIVDGVATAASIDNISPFTVETIELLVGQNASIYGIRGASGVLVINTRQSGFAPEIKTLSPGVLQFRRSGFYKAHEFYSPKYDVSQSVSTRPDLRTTIFWKPEVVTDKDGNASFGFYNADGAGSYRLVIEGIDNAGNIGRQVYRYKVE